MPATAKQEIPHPAAGSPRNERTCPRGSPVILTLFVDGSVGLRRVILFFMPPPQFVRLNHRTKVATSQIFRGPKRKRPRDLLGGLPALGANGANSRSSLLGSARHRGGNDRSSHPR